VLSRRRPGTEPRVGAIERSCAIPFCLAPGRSAVVALGELQQRSSPLGWFKRLVTYRHGKPAAFLAAPARASLPGEAS